MIGTLFNSVDEFLRELERDCADGGLVERDVVRVTNEIRHAVVGHTIIVVASYVVSSLHRANIVELREFAGQMWGHESDVDTRTRERAAAIPEDAIRQACERLELDCRSGVYRRVS